MNILIVDDHQLFADALAMTLRASLLGATVMQTNAAQELALAPDQIASYDLLILDIAMPEISGITLLKLLAHTLEHTKVILCTGSVDRQTVDQAAQVQVDGFIDKSEPVDKLVRAIRTVTAGGRYFSSSYQMLLRDDVGLGSDYELRSGAPQLTPQQTIIIALLEQGKSNKEIAKALELSPNTVKTHLRLMYEKLDVRNRTGCLQKARALGLL